LGNRSSRIEYLILLNSTKLFYKNASSVFKFDHYGVYVAIALFWVISAFYKPLSSLAIWSVVIFMLAFVLIRIVDISMNGLSNTYYLYILLGEILIILIGIYLTR